MTTRDLMLEGLEQAINRLLDMDPAARAARVVGADERAGERLRRDEHVRDGQHRARPVSQRAGVDDDGRLLGIHTRILIDAGAYSTCSPVVLARAVDLETGSPIDAFDLVGRLRR